LHPSRCELISETGGVVMLITDAGDEHKIASRNSVALSRHKYSSHVM